jgi:hypothetical protein
LPPTPPPPFFLDVKATYVLCVEFGAPTCSSMNESRLVSKQCNKQKLAVGADEGRYAGSAPCSFCSWVMAGADLL